jgi:phosphonate metabolism-associated iron-containing alcohol dehydrogenase
MWRFRNPVEIAFGAGAFDMLGAAVAGRPYALVTYPAGEPFDGLARRAAALAGEPVAIVRNVAANPDFESLAESCRALAGARTWPAVIVAIGGGSVLDAAKVLACSGGDFARVRRYLEAGGPLAALPVIAVPTTAGTGSETTCWATVWDKSARCKHSLAHEQLFPERALLDPLLTLGAPLGVTVAAGLDALSHALESLWNVNANPVSAALAVAAAREVLETLPALAADLADAALRARMMRAATQAGLAFSNTKTALAHSLSYHFTLHHGVPHGIACSFSLPLVMRSAIGCDPDCDAALGAIFGADLAAAADRLADFLAELGVSTDAQDHGIADGEWRRLVDDALAGERGRNFIGRREVLLAA